MAELTLCSEAELPEVGWTFADSPDRRRELALLEKNQWIAQGICGYILFRHSDCSAILRDPRWHNSASFAISMMGGSQDQPDSLWMAEGGSHARLRRLVQPTFSPKQADSMRPSMRRLLNESIDAFIHEGEAELMSQLVNVYPMKVIAEMLGLPKNEWETFSKWSEDILAIFRGKATEHIGAMFEAHIKMQAYIKELINQRRETPGDDLISALIAARDEEQQLDETEMMMLIQSIIVGGSDTTRNQIGSVIATLLDHPDQWARIVKDPSLADSATDEAIRYSSITTSVSRFASEDIVYKGILFPRGTLVSLALAVANRDPEVFPDPDRFDIERQGSRQAMTFGGGIHYCLAASLGRAEIQEAVRILAERMPNLRIDGEITWKDPGLGVHAPTALPVAFS